MFEQHVAVLIGFDEQFAAAAVEEVSAGGGGFVGLADTLAEAVVGKAGLVKRGRRD